MISFILTWSILRTKKQDLGIKQLYKCDNTEGKTPKRGKQPHNYCLKQLKQKILVLRFCLWMLHALDKGV